MTKLAPISVVIPAYNEDELLKFTLSALLKQIKLPQEIIVVNNASTDRTKQVARSFIKKLKTKGVTLRVVDELKQGVARARNRGFSEAKHKIIASTDADSQPHPDWILNIEKHFLNHDSIAITGNIIMADAPLLVRIITQLGYFQLLNFAGRALMGFRSVHTANAAIKKSYFQKCGGFNEAITSPLDNDDFEISSRLVALGDIRFDPSLKVDSSFRRYNSGKKVFSTTLRRCQAWYKISRDRQK